MAKRNHHVQHYIHQQQLRRNGQFFKNQTTKINEDGKENLNSPITFKDIEYMVLSLPEISRHDCFTGNSNKHFKNKMLTVHNLLSKIEEEEPLSNHFMKPGLSF